MITLPPSQLPSGASGALTQAPDKPSEANLLMAAATMHQLGRLKSAPKAMPSQPSKREAV